MRFSRNNIITKLLILIIIIWFAITEWNILIEMEVDTVIYRYGGIRGVDFQFPNDLYRLITSGFVHFNLEHLVSNLIIIFILGKEIEDIIGGKKYLLLYLGSIVGGSLLALITRPLILTGGASGAIYGMFGYLIINKKYNSKIKNIFTSYSLLILFSLIHTFFASGVSIAGHIGGLISGIIIGRLIRDKKNYSI